MVAGGRRRAAPASGARGQWVESREEVAGLLLVRGIGEWWSEVAEFRKEAELASYAAMAQVATPSSHVGAACDARVARRVRV